MTLAVILIDHGSRQPESNQLLVEVAQALAERWAWAQRIVEPAHMELAEPTLATAYARCVARGGTEIVVLPFFLAPGRHWTTDIPHLASLAAAPFPETRCRVAAPLGVDPLMLDLLEKRLLAATARNIPETSADS